MPITKKNHGFTLIEIMVAIFVLAIGLLGLAGLQTTSLKNNHSAQQRTEAIIQIYNIIDRMRINKNVAKAGGYDLALGAATPTPAVPPAPTPLEDLDRKAWRDILAAALPGGTGSISTTAGITTITVQWDDSRGSQGSNVQQFVISTEL